MIDGGGKTKRGRARLVRAQEEMVNDGSDGGRMRDGSDGGGMRDEVMLV